MQALRAAESWIATLSGVASAADTAPFVEQTTRRDLLQRQRALLEHGACTIRDALPVLTSNNPSNRASAFETLQQFEGEWQALQAEADDVVEDEVASSSAALTERNQRNFVMMPISSSPLSAWPPL